MHPGMREPFRSVKDERATLVEPSTRRRYERVISAVTAAKDAEGLGALLDLERQLRQAIDERIDVLHQEGLSYRELARATTLTDQTLANRVARGRSAAQSASAAPRSTDAGPPE